MFGAEGRAAAPIIAAVVRGPAQGEVDIRFDPAFVAGLMVMHVIGAVGMVERGQMDPTTATEQARLALLNAIAAGPEPSLTPVCARHTVRGHPSPEDPGKATLNFGFPNFPKRAPYLGKYGAASCCTSLPAALTLVR
jgi:hypothetical protein